ncbi:hypothetical protein [Dorea longicatena]|uniref:hypothetical protein n=1 Tax=Dorea longicatena TaxID=88431 RepID=UPI00156DF943|nr:hypothetical protein [Dorea longicatena]NSD67283.1 hypothetical protein [Dorea longicatena]
MDNLHYFEAEAGKVVLCTEEEKIFIGKILEDRISLSETFKTNNEFEKFVKKEILRKDR